MSSPQEPKVSRVNRQWILKSRSKNGGPVTPSMFESTSETIPALKDGQVLAQVLYLSFDPTQKNWMEQDTYVPKVELGEIVRSIGVAQVLESNHSSFKPGDIVVGLVGWQEYVVFEPDDKKVLSPFNKLPGHLDPLRTLNLSVTGLTGYFGIKDVGKVKAGDTVLVSGAAGSTGSFAAQIAKILGAKKVVGIAGGPEKCKWLMEKAGCDAAIDYKNDNIDQRLKEISPDGVDVFFDNVGGELLDTVLMHLAMEARVVLCGAISQYNKMQDMYGLKNSFQLIVQRATMKGFIVTDYQARSLEGLLNIIKWMDQGKLVAEIDEQAGFENIPSTLERLFSGKNLGKQVLKLADKPLPTNDSVIEKMAMKALGCIQSVKDSDLWTTSGLTVVTLALGGMSGYMAYQTRRGN